MLKIMIEAHASFCNRENYDLRPKILFVHFCHHVYVCIDIMMRGGSFQYRDKCGYFTLEWSGDKIVSLQINVCDPIVYGFSGQGREGLLFMNRLSILTVLA